MQPAERQQKVIKINMKLLPKFTFKLPSSFLTLSIKFSSKKSSSAKDSSIYISGDG